MSDEEKGGFFTEAFGAIGDLYGGTMEFLSKDDNPLSRFTSLAIAGAMAKHAQPNSKPTGYQGKVDMDLERVRERVPTNFGPNQGRKVGIMSGVSPDNNLGGDMYARGYQRRPGGAGQRYFTDTIYAKRPDTTIPTVAEAEATAKAQAQELAKKNNPNYVPPESPAQEENNMAMGGRVRKYAAGGIAGAHKGYYLGGKTDGMADQVPARIDGRQEARLSDGEFVIPADVVSHLGNGNSDAGAQQLHSMMDGVRKARTGTTQQGKEINPQKFMPKMARGGIAQFAGGGNVNAVQGVNSRFKNQPYTTKFDGTGGEDNNAGGGAADSANNETAVGQQTGTESSLSSWAGDYVTQGILEPAAALGKDTYEAYQGPLTAGTSVLQDQAFTGILDLNNPLSGQSVTKEMGTFTPDQATLDPYMNPYTQNVIDRSAADMRRQSNIDALQDRSAMTAAGAFGGSRDALLRAERASNLNRGIGDMAAQQRAQGFEFAVDRAKAAQEMTNQYGQNILGLQADAGNLQRQIAAEGIAADYEQFREEQDFDYKQLQFMHSLLQGMPLTAQSYSYTEPSDIDALIQAGVAGEDILKYLGYGADSSSSSDTELNYDINNDGLENNEDVGPPQPV